MARVLAESEGAHLVHLECEACGSAVVAVIMNNALGLSTVGLLTDLTPEDVLKFRSNGTVSADEVLELHGWLADPGTHLFI
jgi:hypothetical protein